MWVEPHTFREAAGPDFNTAEVTSEPTACDYGLAKFAPIAADAAPDRARRMRRPRYGFARGGLARRWRRMSRSSRRRCSPARWRRLFAGWLRDDVAPRMASSAPRLHSVENYDDYECRTRNRVIGAKPSNHGNGIAIDVRSFTLADGRRIELTDVTADKPLRQALRDSACARFTTVLGPGALYHDAHIHLDMAQRRHGYRICQWEVREPPPAQVASALAHGEQVPLPPPRPVDRRVKHSGNLRLRYHFAAMVAGLTLGHGDRSTHSASRGRGHPPPPAQRRASADRHCRPGDAGHGRLCGGASRR